MSPKVSVVVPAYNCAAFVGQAVESVLGQSVKDLELIVVDDGSTDATGVVLAGFGSRIRVIHQRNQGVSAARNAGMHAAVGDYLAFLDADDWWIPDKLALQLAAFERFPVSAAVFSDFSIVNERGAVQQERGLRAEYRLFRQSPSLGLERIFSQSAEVPLGVAAAPVIVHHGQIGPTLFLGNFINTCSIMMRHEVARQVGDFDRSLRTQEDYDYWLRIAQHHSFCYVDAPLVARRKRPGQLTRPDQIEEVARSSLQVVERVSPWIAKIVDRRIVDKRLGEKHRELGFVQLLAGHQREARFSFRSSLAVQLGDVRAILMWGLTFLPAQVLQATLALLRWGQRTLRG